MAESVKNESCVVVGVVVYSKVGVIDVDYDVVLHSRVMATTDGPRLVIDGQTSPSKNENHLQFPQTLYGFLYSPDFVSNFYNFQLQ